MPAATSSRFCPFVFAALLATVACVTSGCGSSGNSSTTQKLSGNTSVTITLSSTANDQLSEFGIVLNSISLTSQSGKTVTLLSSPQGAEFMTINGGAAPLTTVTIPQDIYTSATVILGSAQFTCVTVMPAGSASPGSLDQSTYAYGQVPANSVTATLPSPITVTGTSMGISLDLQVLSSATYPSTCYPGTGIAQYSITPTFSLTPVMFSSQPTNVANGKIIGLAGTVTAVATSGNSFTLTDSIVSLTCPCVQPPGLTIDVNGSTVFQGINDAAALSAGTLLDLDGSIQADGSLLATRIAAYDPSALNVMTGPLLFLSNAVPNFYVLGRQQQGQTLGTQPQSLGVYGFSGSTMFQISGQMSNVASLPFVASFNSSNIVAGQNVAVFSQAITDYYGGQSTAATTMTLMPQTINGTIVGTSTSGNFTVYDVSLASYDLLPTLASQPGQTSPLTNPGEVEVYVDSNTQMLNSQTVGVGSNFRFQGLVFNDNGTLRMDCAQMNDGVALTAPASAGVQAPSAGAAVIRQGSEGLPPVMRTLARSH